MAVMFRGRIKCSTLVSQESEEVGKAPFNLATPGGNTHLNAAVLKTLHTYSV